MKANVLLACIVLLGVSCAEAQAPNPNSAALTTAADDTSAPQIDSAKQADIRHLLDLAGASSLAAQSMDQMEQGIRPLMTSSLPPGEYRDKLVNLFFEKFHSKRDSDHLIAMIIPIYDKYYTHDDIKALIRFYESPAGKKMAAALPNILTESQAAGGKWGEELGRQCMIEVLAEHPDLRQALEKAKPNAQR